MAYFKREDEEEEQDEEELYLEDPRELIYAFDKLKGNMQVTIDESTKGLAPVMDRLEGDDEYDGLLLQLRKYLKINSMYTHTTLGKDVIKLLDDVDHMLSWLGAYNTDLKKYILDHGFVWLMESAIRIMAKQQKTIKAYKNKVDALEEELEEKEEETEDKVQTAVKEAEERSKGPVMTEFEKEMFVKEVYKRMDKWEEHYRADDFAKAYSIVGALKSRKTEEQKEIIDRIYNKRKTEVARLIAQERAESKKKEPCDTPMSETSENGHKRVTPKKEDDTNVSQSKPKRHKHVTEDTADNIDMSDFEEEGNDLDDDEDDNDTNMSDEYEERHEHVIRDKPKDKGDYGEK